MSRATKRKQKKVLTAIGNYRHKILSESLLTVKALFEQMQSDGKKDGEEFQYVSMRKEDAAESSTDFDEEVILQAKKLLTEIINGYNYWQDPNKFFEILDPESKSYALFSKYDEQFSRLQELMGLYEMTGIHLSFYLNSDL